jgi:hypothetical protein
MMEADTRGHLRQSEINREAILLLAFSIWSSCMNVAKQMWAVMEYKQNICAVSLRYTKINQILIHVCVVDIESLQRA